MTIPHMWWSTVLYCIVVIIIIIGGTKAEGRGKIIAFNGTSNHMSLSSFEYVKNKGRKLQNKTEIWNENFVMSKRCS